MKDTTFKIKTLLFDAIVAAATFYVAELLAIFCSGLLTKDFVDGLDLSIYFAIPIWTFLFYLVRRQYNFKLTLQQILATALTTFGLTAIFVLFIRHIPSFIPKSDMRYLVPYFAGIILILTKHLTDRLLFFKYYGA